MSLPLASSSSSLTPSLKCLLIIHSRDVTKQELGEFYRHFSNVFVIDTFLLNKKLIEFTNNDVVICDLRKEKCRDWYSQQIKYIGDADNVVFLRNSGDDFNDDDTYSRIKFSCKRLRIPASGFKDKLEFLHNLFQSTASLKTNTNKKKLLKKVLGCLCS